MLQTRVGTNAQHGMPQPKPSQILPSSYPRAQKRKLDDIKIEPVSDSREAKKLCAAHGLPTPPPTPTSFPPVPHPAQNLRIHHWLRTCSSSPGIEQRPKTPPSPDAEALRHSYDKLMDIAVSVYEPLGYTGELDMEERGEVLGQLVDIADGLVELGAVYGGRVRERQRLGRERGFECWEEEEDYRKDVRGLMAARRQMEGVGMVWRWVEGNKGKAEEEQKREETKEGEEVFRNVRRRLF